MIALGRVSLDKFRWNGTEAAVVSSVYVGM